MNGHDEFFIGWEPAAPPSFGRRARLASIVLLLLAPVVGLLLAASQAPFADAVFEFGNVRELEGVVHLLPHPVLEVESPTGGTQTWFLVAFGKHGADAELAAHDGQAVRLRGTLIHRAEGTMVEIESGSVTRLETAGSTVGSTISLGVHTLRGEIVDSKCWLGVMNPGEGKVHRDCASLCIRGGIPPLLVVSGDGTTRRQLLLVDSAGRAVNDRILDVVGEPIEVHGEVVRQGDVWTLRADLGSLRRLALPTADGGS